MNREMLSRKAIGRCRGRKCKMGFPIELRENSINSRKKHQVRLFVRDDVNKFSEKERWSVAFDQDTKRLYFFYGIQGIPSFKVQATKSYSHYIAFTSEEVLDIIHSKGGHIGTTWTYDNECSSYYIQL